MKPTSQAGLPDEKQKEESKEEEAKEQSQAELDRALYDASGFIFALQILEKKSASGRATWARSNGCWL